MNPTCRLLLTIWLTTFCIGVPAAEVINAGIGGNRSHNLLSRLDRDVLAKKPSVVVIMVGTNDRLNSGGFTKPETYRKNVEALVDRIQSAGAKVLLITPPPCVAELLFTRHDPQKFADQSPAERMEEVRGIVIRIAKAKQTGLLDFHRYLVEKKLGDDRETSLLRVPKNSGRTDGVHLTSEGYQRLANLVAKTLRASKFDTRRVVCLGDSITQGPTKEGAKTVTGPNYPAYLNQMLNPQTTP